MAAVLEGHTQAISRISRDVTANEDTVRLSLSILDIMCPRGWIRDREATDDMPRWIHELTGAGQWDIPTLMEFVVTTMHGQPLQPSKMDDWSSTAQIWAPINCTMETLLHILLQQHPLGSLTEFRNNSMVALQQHSPQEITLAPHFFNHGDTEVETKSRRISHLTHRATGLQTPETSIHSTFPSMLRSRQSSSSEWHCPKTGATERAGTKHLVHTYHLYDPIPPGKYRPPRERKSFRGNSISVRQKGHHGRL